MMLQRAGHRVLAAKSGDEAVQVWKRSQSEIDLLITDVALGEGLNGDDVARACRESRPDLPIIFASGNQPNETGKNLETAYGAMYMLKPFTGAQLAKAVDAALKR